MFKFPPERVEANEKNSQMYEVSDYIDPPQEPDTSEDTGDFDPDETLIKAEEGDMDAKWDLVCYMAFSGIALKDADPEYQDVYYTNLRDLAEAGNTPAYIMLGDAILEGIGCEQNTEEAIRWYEKAADEGDPFGNELIGEIYFMGKHAPVDYKKAFEFFTRNEGRKSFCTRYHLGEMYRQGLYVEKDPAKACEYYAGIVDDKFKGHELDDYYWRACYRLAVALHSGEGVERDPARARELLQFAKQRAEERGDKASVADITVDEIDKELDNVVESGMMAEGEVEQYKSGTIYWRWAHDPAPIIEPPSPTDDEDYEDDTYDE